MENIQTSHAVGRWESGKLKAAGKTNLQLIEIVSQNTMHLPSKTKCRSMRKEPTILQITKNRFVGIPIFTSQYVLAIGRHLIKCYKVFSDNCKHDFSNVQF